MKRLFFALIIILAISAVAALVLSFHAHEMRLPAEKSSIALAIKSGGNWLLSYEGALGDPGVLWIAKMLNDKYCHSRKVNDWIFSRFSEFKDDPVEKAYIRLLDPGQGDAPDYATLKSREIYYDDVIIPVVFCKDKDIPALTLDKIFAFRGEQRYDLTHRLLAMTMMKNFDCSTGAKYDLEKSLAEIKTQVNSELASALYFNDLYAERVSFLLYAGEPQSELAGPDEYIATHQDASGGWADPFLFDGKPNPHTSALALWALAQYANSCPFHE